ALSGHALVVSWWSPIAYLWQDAAVVLVYFAIDRVLARAPAIAWTVYAAAVLYIALGVPVTRVMSTPMTFTMWRAAGGALSDSVRTYVTPTNLLWIAAVLATAAGIARSHVVSGFSRTSGLVDGPPK